MTGFAEIWAYLADAPLLWLAATLAAYAAGETANRWAGRSPIVNPVLCAVAILGLALWVTGTPYSAYFEGAQFVHFMLGPATVCLAVPLFRNRALARRAILPILAALLAGSVTAMVSALAIARALGVDKTMLLSLAPKSATAPVAMGVAERLGGSPTLTAVLVIATGIAGAVMATPLLDAMGIRDWRARGFAVGVASHGIGTARAFEVHETAGAFAGLGMGLNALLTALLAPWIASMFL
ncbi:MAG: LrgB family protein [Alphaproteobacteria bacterium]|nr:MAG: LrgB family protein [Alphaproteobacteria bacterium]